MIHLRSGRQRQLLQAAPAAGQARHTVQACRDEVRTTAAPVRPPSSPRTRTARCRCSNSTTAGCSPNPMRCCCISPKARASCRRTLSARARLSVAVLRAVQPRALYRRAPRAADFPTAPRKRRRNGWPRRWTAATRRCGSWKAAGETPFFAGEAMSVADIALYAYTHEAGSGGFDLAAYPAVGAWLGRVEADPGHVPMTGCRAVAAQLRKKKAGQNPAFRSGDDGASVQKSKGGIAPAFRLLDRQARSCAAASTSVTCRALPVSTGSALAADQPALLRLPAADLPVRRSFSISKLTFWPSARLVMPARSTAEMWTKTSAPPASGWMKPKPLVRVEPLDRSSCHFAYSFAFAAFAVGQCQRPGRWYRDFGDRRQQTREIAGLGSIGRNINTMHITCTGGENNPELALSISARAIRRSVSAMKSDSIGT